LTGKREFFKLDFGFIIVAKFVVSTGVAGAGIGFRMESVIRGLAKTYEQVRIHDFSL
jgi:hypothetical protein